MNITFSKRVDMSGRVLHVVISLDALDTAVDAVACLRANRPDWQHFYVEGDLAPSRALSHRRSHTVRTISSSAMSSRTFPTTGATTMVICSTILTLKSATWCGRP